MTQTDAMPPPGKRPARHNRPAPGTPVRRSDSDQRGIVTGSDDWWDSFQLGGVPVSAQVLVEWLREGHPVRHWELISDLTVDTGEEAAK